MEKMRKKLKKLKKHIGEYPTGYSCWRGHSSRKSPIYGGKSRHGKEKETRLFKRFARENLARWWEESSWTALPDDIVLFKGIPDARGRLVWGIENFKKFRRRGKIMVGNNHGVFMENDETKNELGYALTYALICRGSYDESTTNIKFNVCNW